MARSNFGGSDSAGWVMGAPSGHSGVATSAPNLTGGSAWSAAVGGSQYTDLVLPGGGATTVRTDADGFVRAMQGPDGVNEGMWIDMGTGTRFWLRTTDSITAPFVTQTSANATFVTQASANSTYVRRDRLPIVGALGHKVTTVTIYHTIGSLATFQAECDLYQQWNYTTITCDDLSNFLLGTGTLPEKPLLISFDDGYLSQYQAAQELNTRGMKATWYITPNWIDGTITGASFGASEATALTWAQLIQMKAWGMDIQSHTMSHADQSLTMTQGQAQADFAAAKARIEAQVSGALVRHHAYPFGSFNTAVQAGLTAAGCLTARTVAVNPDGTYPGPSLGRNSYVFINCDPLAVPTAGPSAAYVQQANVFGLLSHDANQILDSNWENSGLVWTRDADFSFDVATKHSGSRSLTCINPVGTRTAKQNQLIPVGPFAMVQFSVWIKTTTAVANGVRFYVEGYKRDSTATGAIPYAATQIQVGGTTGWTKYTISVGGDANLYYFKPVLYMAGGAGQQAWFDDLEMRRQVMAPPMPTGF